jgi:WD40 repeat protein
MSNFQLGSLQVFDVETRKLVATAELPTGGASIAFSKDGHTIISTDQDAGVRLWRWETEDDPVVREGHSEPAFSAAVSPDGRTLATASYDGTIRLWADGGRGEVRVLRGHTTAVESVAWSSDGDWLASSGQDGTVRVWNVAEGGLSVTLLRGVGDARSVAWIPGGHRLASFGGDQKIRVIDCDVCIDGAQLDGLVESRVSRDFTDSERAAYLEDG